jgi:uncharacterized protein (TIGR03435 family)
MTEPEDIELLRQYARENSEAAFATLARRHVNLVYSVALRRTGNPHAAEEITQAVFIILARKAKSFSRQTILTGWLHQTTRLTAANFLRTETRRQHREQEAFMQSALSESESWTQIAPLLDDAISKLGERDRNAILLRYFENKSAREMAAALRVDEPAAQKRVTRAVEKLRAFFAKGGVTLTAAAIAGAVSANSVQAAPVGLAVTVTAAAAKGAAVSASTLTLIKGALKIMAWTKMKTTVVASIVLLLAAGTTTVVTTSLVKKSNNSSNDAVYEEIWAHPDSRSIPALEKAPPALIIRPTRYPSRGGGLRANDGKAFWVNGTVSSIIGIAYDCGSVRTIFPEPLPGGNYDVMESLPNGENATALKEEVKKQFGLVAHKEIRETDVFLLKVSDPDKLQTHFSKAGNASAYMTGDNKMQNFHFINETISDLAKNLEGWFDSPIVDRSGLSDHYNFEFQWASNMVGKKRVTSTLRDQLTQLGLELVPGREPIEMLVVEKVKQPE